MSFETKYINYGSLDIPIYKDLYGNLNYNVLTEKGIQFYTRIFGSEVINPIGGTYFNRNANTTLFILGNTKSNKYLHFIFNYNISPSVTNNIIVYKSDGINGSKTLVVGTPTLGYIYLSNNYNALSYTNNRGFFVGCEVYYNNKWDIHVIGFPYTSINTLLEGEADTITYSPEFGKPSESGGYSGGSFDNSSDTIAIPNKPSIGVTNVGFVNVYNPSTSGLINLGSELFPDFTPPQPAPLSADITEALQLGFNNVVENITNFTNMFINSKLIDYVIDCHVIPIKPTVTDSESIKIGFKSFNQTANKVTSDYIDFDCGSLNIKEYYTNFIDYVGTRAKLYLPFVGFVPIENEYFQNGILNVKYRFNVIDGSFMCYVVATSSKSELKNSVIASYGGNACVHIPITGLNYSNMITGLASGTVATIATASIGGGLASKALSPALASAGVAVGTLNSALNTLATKPSMQSSNGYNSTSAYLGIRYPYLVIEREVSNFSEYYTSENGLPCNITKTINELSGYVEMDNIHMETLTCTDEEKTMIENLLKSGIIV